MINRRGIMQKQVKRVLLELVSFLIIFGLDLWIRAYFTQKINETYTGMQEEIIVLIFVAFLLGILFNVINKKASTRFNFNILYFVVFLVCALAIVFSQVFYQYLPVILQQEYFSAQYLIAIYAGANFISALFYSHTENG
jgi:hypothetical protein